MWSTKTAPRRERREGAVGAGGDRAQVVVVADAGEDDLGASAAASAGVAARAPPCCATQSSARLARAVVDGDLMALGGEVAGHRGAHHAEPDECDARHAIPPLTLRPLYRP